jgi:hypothetical protein
VHGLRGGERGDHLVDQLALLPWFPRLVQEHLQLRCDVSESGGRAERDPVCPFKVNQCRRRLLADLGAVAAPRLVLGDQQLRRELLDVT